MNRGVIGVVQARKQTGARVRASSERNFSDGCLAMADALEKDNILKQYGISAQDADTITIALSLGDIPFGDEKEFILKTVKIRAGLSFQRACNKYYSDECGNVDYCPQRRK